MTTRSEFLTTVLADEGLYCVVGLKKKRPPVQEFKETIEELGARADELTAQGYDAYFGCAKYLNDQSREVENAKWFKSFWIDLDCGEGKPYDGQAEALAALKEFIRDTGIPFPYVVNSGRGVHAYWPLTQTIFFNEWKPVAEALKRFCLSNNLKIDLQPTADAARILRLPDTLNFKDTPPNPTSVMKAVDPIEISRIKSIVGVVDEDDSDPSLPFSTSALPRRPMDATTRALMGNNISKFSHIMRRSAQGKGCNQLVNIYQNQEGVEEPLWRAGLSIAVNCEDGELAIHKISHGHPEYDPVETKQKADRLINRPYKCETFAGLNPDGCADCPIKGSITSPIQIGSTIAAAKPEDNIIVMHNATLQEDVKLEIPEFPFPYFRGKNGGVYIRGEDPDSDDPNERDKLVYEYDLYVVKRLTDPDAGESLWMRLHMPKDGVREFSAPLATIVSRDKLRDLFAYHGVTAYNKKLDGLMAYVTRWTNELQQLYEAEKARQQFGWCEDDTKFIVGNREISSAGVSYSPSSTATSEIAAMYSKRGSIHEWTKAADLYGRPGNEARAFCLFASFGAALFKFTNLKGAIVHLTNNSSGVGKTTILHMINSVWGNPIEAMLTQEDKLLARMNRLSLLGNIPSTIDELTNAKDEEISQMSYAITHGRGRNRMQSQINAERSNLLRWALIAFTSGNKSLYDQLYNIKDFPEGELMRIIELNIDKADDMSKAESDQAFNPMYENYGVAGEIFMRYVVPNLPEVLKMLAKVQRRFDKAANFTQRERFWSGVASVAITAGILSKRLGLHNIDVQQVYNWASGELGRMRVEVRPGRSGPLNSIGLFLNKHHSNMLIVSSLVDKRSGLTEAPIQEPRGPLITRFEPDTKLLYITCKDLREWCSENQVSYKSLLADLETAGVSRGVVKKSLSRGANIATPSVSALVIDNEKAGLMEPEDTVLPSPSDDD